MRLPQSSILLTAHFHSDRLQNLFNAHIPIPISHRGEFVLLDDTRFRINAGHVDFRRKSNVRWYGRIIVRASNFELIKSSIVLSLDNNNTNEEESPC